MLSNILDQRHFFFPYAFDWVSGSVFDHSRAGNKKRGWRKKNGVGPDKSRRKPQVCVSTWRLHPVNNLFFIEILEKYNFEPHGLV